jgi:hypothetical protein
MSKDSHKRTNPAKVVGSGVGPEESKQCGSVPLEVRGGQIHNA